MTAEPIVRKESIHTNADPFFRLSVGPQPIAWPGPEEMGTSMPWDNADLLVTQRIAAARAFAKAIADFDRVEGVWLREVVNEFEVCVVLSEIDLDFDLSLREQFIELVSERVGPGEGDLFIYQRDVAPDSAFQGTRLAV